MKKILALLISFQILTLPTLAAYDFSDEAQAEFDRKKFQPVQSAPVENDFYKKREHHDRTNYTPPVIQEEVLNNTFEPAPQPLLGNVVHVPAGTTFKITFDSGISSGSLEKNDRLTAALTENFIYNGVLIAPAGSLVYGTAIDAQNAGYAYGSGAMEFTFNEILTPDGNLIKISTETITMEEKSERAKKMTRDIVIGALGSMLVGAAFTALSGSDSWGRNMLIYGGVGALGGGVRGAMQRGREAYIPDGTTFELKLNQPLNAAPYRNFN